MPPGAGGPYRSAANAQARQKRAAAGAPAGIDRLLELRRAGRGGKSAIPTWRGSVSHAQSCSRCSARMEIRRRARTWRHLTRSPGGLSVAERADLYRLFHPAGAAQRRPRCGRDLYPSNRDTLPSGRGPCPRRAPPPTSRPDNARQQDLRIANNDESAKQAPLVAEVINAWRGAPGGRDFCPGLRDFALRTRGRYVHPALQNQSSPAGIASKTQGTQRGSLPNCPQIYVDLRRPLGKYEALRTDGCPGH